MEKIYNKKSKEDKEKEVNELFKKANEGIENCFSSIEQLKELADYMSKFYNYSLRNTFLIQEQFEGAFAVGSYSFWKDKGFSVNKGEKGIKILVPNKLSDYFINSKGEETKLSKATTEEKKLIEEGKIELKKGNIIFNQGYVFDVSQTNAKAEDLPKIFPGRWLDGEVKNYDLMYKAMENIAKKIEVKIIEPKSELGAAKGAAYPLTKEVALNPRNTELQNVKTLIHELAHAKLHTIEKIDNYTTNEREFQAEMTAYVVSSYFGIDTSEYSFRYISSWSKDTELKEKLINEVKETVKEYVEIIENTLINDKELSLSLDNISIDTEITNNREKEQFLNLNKEELAKIYERQMTEEEKVFIEKQGLKLSDVVENFKEVLEEFDIEKFSFKDYLIETMGTYNELFNTSKEITIDNISIDTKITNNREKEEFLNLNKEDLIKVYEKELSETTKSLIRECELNLSSLVNTFKDTLDDYFVKEDNSIGISFEYFLNYEIFGYTLTEEEQIKNENRVKGNENMKIGLTQKEVNKMVKDHEEWINTKGKKGKRLDLEGKELNGIRLLNVNLKEANLKNMTIKDSTIFANLDGADFEGTKIENSKFIGSKIENLKIDAKELERINIQIKEELSLHNESESTLKTNKNKRKTKEKNNENEIQI
ncbi:ImmA/IrrE family metallo-endopeptidase [Clostridium cadaveris]|uniref:ImmA/IrrE family metallo-endopeptidase n=1 Tax=Clostridium cadaveris TaxID=1529 RepID=UPI0014599066|nr:ImmA/IrrE family metallo-endopeptidase [Clostridium cadaveris]